jgi:hypothetical protein
MYCSDDPDTLSVGICANCGRTMCRKCAVWIAETPYCKSCSGAVPVRAAQVLKCPLTLSANTLVSLKDGFSNFAKGSCAWWDIGETQCSVLTLSRSVSRDHQALSNS